MAPDEVYREGGTAQASVPLSGLLQAIVQQITPGTMRARIVVGAAGVGKTLLCKKACHELALDEHAQVLPLYIPLGEWDPSESWTGFLQRLVGDVTIEELVMSAEEEHFGFVFFLDGLNEQHGEQIREAWSYLRDFVAFHPAVVVLTTRPMPSLLSRWPGEDLRFFRLGTWSDNQLQQYLELNTGLARDYAVSVPMNELLHLPLVAFLFVYTISDRGHALTARTLSDIFDALLDYAFGTDAPHGVWLDHDPRRLLRALAYAMTTDEVVQADVELLAQIIAVDDQVRYHDMLDALCLSGLLRRTSARRGPHGRVRISLFHQAFQDYLVAQELIERGDWQLPSDLSSNAFWRDIPAFILQSLPESAAQFEFTMSFIPPNRADYLTAARLIAYIRDAGLRRVATERTLEHLIENLAAPDLYTFAIEAFRVLGTHGLSALHRCVSDVPALTQSFTEFERHLVPGGFDDTPDEAGWRPLGRATYVLGELGDLWLCRHYGEYLPKVRSLHLLYHVGEALLELARRAHAAEASADAILNIGRQFGSLSSGDRVTEAQHLAIERRLTGAAAAPAFLDGFRAFLRERYVVSATHFGDEFWRRAHGIEVYGELADDEDCRDEFTHLLRMEDTAPYGDHPVVAGYRLVQSSVLKSAARCLGRGAEADRWTTFLEAAFSSPRVAENAWACRYLEEIMLTWFAGPAETEWLRDWLTSDQLGGQRIRRALANTLRKAL